MIINILLTIVASFSFLFAERPVPEFQIVPKNQLGPFQIDAQWVIHETENDYILKSPLTNFVSYDYYFLQLPPGAHNHPWFYNNAKVITEKPGEFLILEIRNENQLLAISQQAHQRGHFCGLMQKLSPEPIVMEKRSAQQEVGPYRSDIASTAQKVKIDNILQTMETMVSWETRYESDNKGMNAGEKLQQLYQSLVPADRNDIEVELFDHQGSPQKSIVVRIKGQTQPDEYVILGSHIDSINQSNHAFSPGADDNASGTATNMEVFRVLMESGFRPQRTIEIHGYAAEEIGLVGSQEIAESFRKQNKKVISMVQFDMNAFANGNAKITFVSNGTDSSLSSQLRQLVKNYNTIPSSSGYLLFGSSDHASWAKQGFPVAFPTEDPFGFNRKIHTGEDVMDNINSPKQIEEFGKLGVAYLMDFSN